MRSRVLLHAASLLFVSLLAVAATPTASAECVVSVLTPCDDGDCVVNAGFVSPLIGGGSGCSGGSCVVNTAECNSNGSCPVNIGGCDEDSNCTVVFFAYCTNDGSCGVVTLTTCDGSNQLVLVGRP